MRRIILSAFCLASALAVAAPARAAELDASFSFVGAGANAGLAASAVFHDAGGGVLQITLTNNGTTTSLQPGTTLSALLFNCNCGTLVPLSAVTSGNIVLGSSSNILANTGANVGGEFGFGTQTNVGTTQVVTSTGAFGSGTVPNSGPGNFNGSDLDGQNALGGISYGIVPTGGVIDLGQPGPDNPDPPVIQHDVIFKFTGFNGQLSNITNVAFQYGTSTSEFRPNGNTGSGGGSGQTLVPEPTSLLLFGSGLAMTAYRARRSKKNQKQ